MPLTVRLYTKPQCHLCERAQAILARVSQDTPLCVEVVDIATLGDRAEAMRERVPVIEVDGQEAQAGKISEWRLRGWLRDRGYTHAAR